MAITEIRVPDIGDFNDVEVIEVLVAAGDSVAAEDSLITLESDKAAMEVPSPADGIIKELKVKLGDKISEGDLIALLDAADTTAPTPPAAPSPEPEPAAEPKAAPAPTPTSSTSPPAPRQAPAAPPVTAKADFSKAHASPSIRRFARELGVDLNQLSGSGRKGRIVKDDVQQFVKQAMSGQVSTSAASGVGIPPIPAIDFSKFGEIETQALTRIEKLSGPHLHRAWLNVPMVTHHDEADITELEDFRKSLKAEAEKQGVRVTALAFITKALVNAMQAFPKFNASLAPGGESLILKHYFNIGIAVDTPNGLVVPVLRDVDKKSIFEFSAELGEVSLRARDGKLTPKDLSGGCMSISSLGGIGGTAFTPLVNAPEVAILGVARSQMKPVWNGKEFVPRLMLPLALTYDHRVIDGALGARFMVHLCQNLSDLRRLLL